MAALPLLKLSGNDKEKKGDWDKRMELTEHLGELRTHLIRSLVFLLLGAVFAYQFFSPLYGLLYKPLEKEMKKQNAARVQKAQPEVFIMPHATSDPPSRADYDNLAKSVKWVYDHPVAVPLMSIVFRNFHEPFMVRFKISIIYGFILVMPFVVREFVLFVLPALTPQERRPLRLLTPISVLLLVFGVAVAYYTMFFAMHWFLSYLDDFPQPAVLMQDPNDYIVFFVKMIAAFGLAFQLPVVLMGGAFIGLVTSKGLIKHWRWGVIVAALGGLITPSNDLFSMLLMIIPLLILYAASILLVKIVERMKSNPLPA